MIFKKNSDWPQSQSKTYAAAQKQPQLQVKRREPEISTPTNYQHNYSAPQSAYHAPPQVAAAATVPAQPRRTPGPARSDQPRKLTVGRDISLQGEITTCDHLVVEGTVKATIKGGKILEITDTGAFSGIVDIEQADIAGQFEGDLIVRGKLTIRPTAYVTGHIHYARLQVDTGATINGQLNPLNQQVIPVSPVVATDTQDDETTSEDIVDDEQARLFSFTAINDEPGFLKASA